MKWIPALGAALLLWPASVAAQDTTALRESRDSVSVHFVDADLRAVIQALGRYLSKPVISANVQPARVTLETPGAVERRSLLPLLRGVVASQGETALTAAKQGERRIYHAESRDYRCRHDFL